MSDSGRASLHRLQAAWAWRAGVGAGERAGGSVCVLCSCVICGLTQAAGRARLGSRSREPCVIALTAFRIWIFTAGGPGVSRRRRRAVVVIAIRNDGFASVCFWRPVWRTLHTRPHSRSFMQAPTLNPPSPLFSASRTSCGLNSDCLVSVFGWQNLGPLFFAQPPQPSLCFCTFRLQVATWRAARYRWSGMTRPLPASESRGRGDRKKGHMATSSSTAPL